MSDSLDLHAEFYDGYESGTEEELDFYRAECGESGGPVLEFGCGTGRVLEALARAGIEVHGVDLSEAMLRRARARLAETPREVRDRATLVKGDMRTFESDRRFAAILFPHNTFAYLRSTAEQLEMLRRTRSLLANGGRAILVVPDPRVDIIAASLSGGGGLRYVRSFQHPDTGRRVQLWSASMHEPASQLGIHHMVFEEVDDSGASVRRVTVPLVLRMTPRMEMEHLLARSGFATSSLSSDYTGSPFRYGESQVWVVRIA